ncbi:hypothetical protein BDR26DRAFT_849170 [Obelidium mucronatum]|nr:hypothetical protein BDR26DRAFT_849170 [Obelidium mucronatum]
MDFSHVPVAKMEDFILKPPSRQHQQQQQKSQHGPKYANRRPETAIAKDFFRAFLAAKGEESRFRPDTAVAKSHYRAFLSAKPDDRILGMMGVTTSILGTVSAAKPPPIPAGKSPTPTPSARRHRQNNIPLDLNGVSCPALQHPGSASSRQNRLNHTSSIQRLDDDTHLLADTDDDFHLNQEKLPFHNNTLKSLRSSTPKSAVKLQEAKLSTSEFLESRPSTTTSIIMLPRQQSSTPRARSLKKSTPSSAAAATTTATTTTLSRPQTVPSKLPATIRVFTPPPLSTPEAESSPLISRRKTPHSKNTTSSINNTCAATSTSPPTPISENTVEFEPRHHQQQHPLLPDVILNYINRSRKSVRNRVTHGTPRKPTSPQKLAQPHEKRSGNGKWKNTTESQRLTLEQQQQHHQQQKQNNNTASPAAASTPTQQKNGVLPSVTKKVLNSKSGSNTRPGTQHKMSKGKGIAGGTTTSNGGSSDFHGGGVDGGGGRTRGGLEGGERTVAGADSWETFQNCLETAKALGQGANGNPMSLLDTAELVTQLWNHYRVVKKHA